MIDERGKSIKLKCPKCGAGVRHWFYLENAAISRDILWREGNTIHITADYDVEAPNEAADENPRFVCMGNPRMMRTGESCNTVILVPDGLKLECDE
jgi:hypothetical protein